MTEKIDEKDLLAEAHLSLRHLAGDKIGLRRPVLQQLLLALQHYRELAGAPRYAEIGPGQEAFAALDMTLAGHDPNVVLQLPARVGHAARHEYTCARCLAPFVSQRENVLWLCSRAEECPLCRPLCLGCIEAENKDISLRATCPNSGLPVKAGAHVRCQCGAVFADVDKMPVHKPGPPEGQTPIEHINVANEIHEALLVLELDGGRDLTDLVLAMGKAAEMDNELHRLRERNAELEQRCAAFAGPQGLPS